MEAIQPYLKYILYLIAIIAVALANWRVIHDGTIRKIVIDSLRDEKGKVSGKSIAAMMFCLVVALAALISIHFAPNHTIPEFMFYGIISLIFSLYGIKEVGRVMTAPKDGNGNGSNGNGSTNQSTDTQTQSPVTEQPVVQAPVVEQPVVQSQPTITSQLTDLDIPAIIQFLQQKFQQSGSQSSFEDWIKEFIKSLTPNT